MRKIKTLALGISLLLTTTVAISQQNSPWEKFKDETISGVVVAPGCHQYSLSNGQGYSVYLRNTNAYPVNVSGTLIAKTVCGKEVSTNFSVNLQPGETAPGSDFYNGSKTGQTSVVTANECYGNRYSKTISYLDRIANVRATNVNVTNLGSSSTANTSLETSTKVSGSTVATTLINKFDSVGFYRNLYTTTNDSLSGEIYLLKNQNRLLLDSVNYYKNVGASSYTNSNVSSTITNTVSSTVSKSLAAIKPFDLLLQAGLGFDNLPSIVNNDSTVTALPTLGSTYSGSTAHPLLQVGLLAKLFTQSPINVELNPFVSYGSNLGGGITGKHLTYGIGANILAALGKTLPLKLVALGNYTARNGDWTKTPESADYDYNFIKYGGGLRYTIKNGYWIQPTISFDQLNVSGAEAATVIGIESLLNNKFSLGLNYSSKYINQGTVKYVVTNLDDKSYFAVRLLYNIGLLK